MLEAPTKKDKFVMDGHKMLWHMDRVDDWRNQKRIAPIHIDAGLSKGCNIKCQYCFGVVQGNFYRKGSENYFPREALLRYMRDCGDLGVRSVALIGEAEPTLNPHLYEAIVEGSKAGVDMSLGTNGVLYKTDKEGQEALEHLTWFRFNISAASDYWYRRIHASQDFDKAVEKIKFCVDYKKKHNLKTTIGLQMVLTPENLGQAVPLAQLGKSLEVDYLVIKQCSDTILNEIGVFDRLDQYQGFTESLREAEEIGDNDYSVIVKWDKIQNEGHRNYDSCVGAPFLLYSSGDGKLYSCGDFFEGEKEEPYRLGDLVEKSFKEIIESDHYWNTLEKIYGEVKCKTDCYSNCRTHHMNEFLWKVKDSSQEERDNLKGQTENYPIPQHVNFA